MFGVYWMFHLSTIIPSTCTILSGNGYVKLVADLSFD